LIPNCAICGIVKVIAKDRKAVSAKDIFHDVVKIALQKNGWLITHDRF
jgi:hypothetical protein